MVVHPAFGFPLRTLTVSDSGNDILLGGDLQATWTSTALTELASKWGTSYDSTLEQAVLAALADTEQDILVGGAGRDWFFVRGGGEGSPLDYEALPLIDGLPYDKQSLDLAQPNRRELSPTLQHFLGVRIPPRRLKLLVYQAGGKAVLLGQ